MNTSSQAKLSCAILGAKGFVGSAIVREASSRGYKVTPIDLEDYAAAKGKSFDLLINANGNSKKFLAAKDPAMEFDLSVRSVMKSLQDFEIKQYVHLSTIDVYPNHEDPAMNTEDTSIDLSALSPYGLHKYMAEQLIRYYGPEWKIVRMGGFVGPNLWKNSIYDLLTGKTLRVHPDSSYQYLHTSDLARLLFILIEQEAPFQTWNISGKGLVSLSEVASWIPNVKLPDDTSSLPLQRYEVNVSRIQKAVDLPETKETVKRFVENVLAKRENIK